MYGHSTAGGPGEAPKLVLISPEGKEDAVFVREDMTGNPGEVTIADAVAKTFYGGDRQSLRQLSEGDSTRDKKTSLLRYHFKWPGDSSEPQSPRERAGRDEIALLNKIDQMSQENRAETRKNKEFNERVKLSIATERLIDSIETKIIDEYISTCEFCDKNIATWRELCEGNGLTVDEIEENLRKLPPVEQIYKRLDTLIMEIDEHKEQLTSMMDKLASEPLDHSSSLSLKARVNMRENELIKRQQNLYQYKNEFRQLSEVDFPNKIIQGYEELIQQYRLERKLLAGQSRELGSLWKEADRLTPDKIVARRRELPTVKQFVAQAEKITREAVDRKTGLVYMESRLSRIQDPELFDDRIREIKQELDDTSLDDLVEDFEFFDMVIQMYAR